VADIITPNNEIIVSIEADESDYIYIYNMKNLTESLGCLTIDENNLGESLRNEITTTLGIEFTQFMKNGKIPIARQQEKHIISTVKSMWVIVEGEKRIIVKQ